MIIQGILLFTDDVHPPPSTAHDEFALGAVFKKREKKEERKRAVFEVNDMNYFDLTY